MKAILYNQILLRVFTVVFLVFFNIHLVYAQVDLNKLSDIDALIVKSIVLKLEPFLKQKEALGTKYLLSFKEFFMLLNDTEKELAMKILELDATKIGVYLPYRGFASNKTKFITIVRQLIKSSDLPYDIPGQFLPKNVFEQYKLMMKAMRKDIGKVLFIESGYRSGAYQLYLFLNSLQNHEFSIKVTAKFVALPGFSDHGSAESQAIDFISQRGVNCNSAVEKFEALSEYKWLLMNAQKYGFVLAYPKDNPYGISFEPWHWRFNQAVLDEQKNKSVSK